MKSKLSKLVLAMICALALGASLVACSNSSPSSSAAGSSPAAKADVSKDFAGTWKLAGAEYQGLIAVGDFENSDTFKELAKMEFVANEDGTGKLTMNDQSKTFKWEADGKDVKVTWDKNSASASSASASASASSASASSSASNTTKSDTSSLDNVKVSYDAENKAVLLTPSGEDTNEIGSMIFTKDGKYKDYEPVDVKSTKAITDTSKLDGTWKIVGIGTMGMTMFGSAEDIQKAMGDASSDMTIKDGKCTIKSGDSSETYDIKSTADGTVVSMDFMGTVIDCPVTAFGDQIILDMTPAFGGYMDMFFIYEK